MNWNLAVLRYWRRTTEISVYQNGHLKNISVLPIGGDHITNDIAGLKDNTAECRKLKLDPVLLRHLAADDKAIELPQISGKKPRIVPVKELAMIIESRLVEILYCR